MDMEMGTIGVFGVYVLIFFIAILFRYFLAAGMFFYYFYVLRREVFKRKRLSRRPPKKDQFRKEIIWSVKSSVIFAFFGAVLYWLWEKDLTAIYLDPSAYGFAYLPLSLVLVFFLHETYYYWIHRWMHHPKVFRKVHKVHHDSHTPTPWTAFSFHPWESLLEAVILPVILLVIPVNVYVLGIYLVLMTLSSVVNHLDIEIYPEAFRKSKFGKLFIGATHHNLHHKEYLTNYGLYFTFWDKWMATESERMS